MHEKKDSYSHLNMKDVTNADYVHVRIVCKDFKRKMLEEYHDSYVHSDTLLLSDVFENFRNMCIKIYEVGSAPFLTVPG